MSILDMIRQHRRRAEYKRYMRSDTWHAIRDVKLSIAAYECEQCGARDRLDVHHLTYDRFGGDERMTDLRVLCRPCHETAHGRKF
jgi:5-methylcytosine-specific restriction endonuclease McrA